MKYSLIFLLLPTISFADFSKPELLARYSGVDAWNAPENTSCFSSEPLATDEAVYLGCQNADGFKMLKWTKGYSIVGEAKEGRLFSTPQNSKDGVSWYEFDEAGGRRLFLHNDTTHAIVLKDIGPTYSTTDAFSFLGKKSWAFRAKGEDSQLWIMRDKKSERFFYEEVSYIFPLLADAQGNLIMKTRYIDLAETSPDRLWIWDGEWKVFLEDREANPESPFLKFRHQIGFDNGRAVLVATTNDGEGLYLIEKNQVTLIAKIGSEIKSFDYFSPKIKNDVIAFRGVDSQNKKSLWAFTNNKLKKVLTQGDVIHTDKGAARVDYKSQDALFYGAPGISPKGNILQQATLTDFSSPNTLLGIGLINIQKE